MEDNRDKKIEDYLHLYLGAGFQLVDDYTDGMITFKPNDRLMLTVDVLNQVHKWWMKGKPILRPLSDMTEEEFNILVKEKFNYSRFIKTRIENETESEPAAIYFIGIKLFNNKEVETQCTQYISSLKPSQFLLLLSKHFDLFNLHEAGLCLYKTDLK